jgi:hypothetical protein
MVYNFPTLRVGGIKIVGVAVSDSRTTTAEAQELAFCTFFEFLKTAIAVHLLAVINIMDVFLKDVANRAIKAATS